MTAEAPMEGMRMFDVRKDLAAVSNIAETRFILAAASAFKVGSGQIANLSADGRPAAIGGSCAGRCMLRIPTCVRPLRPPESKISQGQCANDEDRADHEHDQNRPVQKSGAGLNRRFDNASSFAVHAGLPKPFCP
jgi:hypothetical protein